MLKNLDLDQSITKSDFKQMLPDLQNRLYSLQKATWEARIPVIVVVEGWESCGKGSVLRRLTSSLDPRGFRLHSIPLPDSHELAYPWMHRFWLRIPERGAWAIFDRSWYTRVLDERMRGEIPEVEWRRAYRDIVDFERTLVEDGYLIVKYFLHISKRMQAQRLDKRQNKKNASKHPNSFEWEQNHRYDEWLEAIEEMFAQTDTEWGPWTPVESADKRFSSLRIYHTLSDRLEDRLAKSAPFEIFSHSEPEPKAHPDEEPLALEMNPEPPSQVEEDILSDHDASS
jgi:polyphosphate kinase 2 (PPK2 family)